MTTKQDQQAEASKQALLESAYDMYKSLGDYDAAQLIIGVITAMENIIQSNDQLFSIKKNPCLRFPEIQTNGVGQDFLTLLQIENSRIQAHYPRHKLNPLVELYLKCIDEYQLHSEELTQTRMGEIQASALIDRLNGCIDAIRKESKLQEFKKSCANNLRKAKENSASLIRYVNWLRNKYSRLLVLRIDLSYLEAYIQPKDGSNSIKIEEFLEHRDAFFRTFRRILPPNSLAGFIWKLEHAKKKSWHIHAVIFLKGHAVRGDVTIARILGEHWAKNITKGKGLYFNCNHWKEDRYKGACAIGMLEADDSRWKLFEDKVISYITKPDLHAKLVLSGNGHTLGKGIMPSQDETKQGRPRSTEAKNLPIPLL